MDYKEIANKVIDIEIAGLTAIKDKFNQDYVKLIDLILNLKGRVILSGMGKSGHIAKKISATLSSTGTSSFFIHPAEASHGDLGMITSDDLVILLSNSGETKELSDIIHYSKRFGIKLIALVRRKESILVQESDIAIVLPEIKEASNVNAPTTSTIMMMAFGDALAVTLANVKGFTKNDFSVFHPGGKLGSAFIKIAQIMRTDEDIPVTFQDKLMSEVIIEMSKKSLGCIAVIDKDKNLKGIITDGDLRRYMQENFLSLTAEQVMTKNPITMKKDILAISAVNLMNKKEITSVFITEGRKITGVIHINDCFKMGIV